MQFTARVTSITQDKIVPKVFDNILSDNLATFRFLSNGKKWIGESLKIPIKLVKSTHGGSFSGLDTHSTATVEARRTMIYYPKAYEIPVAVPGLERLVNATDAQVLGLVKTEMESASMDAADDVGDIWYGDGTGNAGKDFEGFGNIIDDGTVSDTIGTLSRTTWPTLEGYRLASGGLMNLTKLGSVYVNVSGGSAITQKPTIIISDETRWNLYEGLLTPTVRANYDTNGFPVVTRRSRGAIPSGSLKGGQGFSSIIYRGVPWAADQKCDTNIFFVNERYYDWYGITDPQMTQVSFGQNHEGTYSEAPGKFTGLQFSGMMKPVNQYGDVGHVYLFGNAATPQPRRNGIFTGVTTI